jgi:hypothetical protein
VSDVKATLIEVLKNPFDGQDVVEAVNSPTVLENLRMVFGPLISDGFVTEMVGTTEIRQAAGAVWTLDGGRLSRVEFHLDAETGRRAAGLDG